MAATLKIAFLGNQNNNHFAVVRYLRDRGYDVELLLTDSEQDHFHPKCDAYDTAYTAYTKQLSWGSERRVLTASTSIVREDLSPYDVLVGTGYAPAYLAKADIQLDVFVPYGWDIWNATFYKLASPRYQLQHSAAVYWQRAGLGRADVLHAGVMNDQYERQVAKHLSSATRWTTPVPMVYAPQYENLCDIAGKTHWADVFKSIRDDCDLMIMAPARQQWYDPGDPNSKGTDILVHGYRLFCDNHPSLNVRMVFVEYGNDTGRTKQLIKNLGLEERVEWLPKMYRKDLMVGLKYADICCGQFGVVAFQNGVLFESLVAGKPILSWHDEELYRNKPRFYPVYNANTPDVIAQRLGEYVADPEVGRQMGRIGRQWYDEAVVEDAIEKYCDYFEKRADLLGKAPF